MDKPKVDFVEQLRKNWPIILFIGTIIFGWNDMKNDNAENAKDIADQKVELVAIKLKTENYQVQVAEISGDIKAIKESLTYIKEKVK